MNKRTPLYEQHQAMGAKLVDFAGWDMPLHYGSQIREHGQVRSDAGMFDVSHMVVVDIKGAGSKEYLSLLLANNVGRLKTEGRAMYSCMLNAQGGVIDDLIVYHMNDRWYRMVINADTRDKDLKWMRDTAEQASGVEIVERDDLAIIAVQGPHARTKVYVALGEGLKQKAEGLSPFEATTIGELFVGRTGYTGEDGFEIILPAKAAEFSWKMLAEVGVSPIGLGARDTLRLEAGMNLYGADMDESTSPLVSGLAWTIGWAPDTRRFVGRDALEQEKMAGPGQQLVGLVLQGKGVLRNHQRVTCNNNDVGEITSGSFSPSLRCAIALARVTMDVAIDSLCQVDVRGKYLDVRVVKPPFVRNGKSLL
ncbi:MAG TPA: glycine cleavage system aminomethyltransferase GcvT [Acidiferrobacteraceae bacterium]|nr:glycine cleavage system aminomethyltransferase GcvT [Acidiferrobacteraceae bacterium]